MPVEVVAVRSLAIPVPFGFFPYTAYPFPDCPFIVVVGIEELQGRNESLIHEGGLHKVASVVLFAEPGYGLSGLAIHEMRIDTVMALSLA